MSDFQITAPEAFEASTTGALAGFESRCSCGLVMRNAFRVSLGLDVRQHVAYHEAKASKGGRKA